MKFKAFFLCIIFLTSCKSFNSDIEFFEAKKYTDWFFTHKIKLFNKHYFNTNQVIRRPVLSWQLLAWYRRRQFQPRGLGLRNCGRTTHW